MNTLAKSVWQRVAKKLPLEGLKKLRDALANDDPRLCQRRTVVDDLHGNVLKCCAISYCFWEPDKSVEDIIANFDSVLMGMSLHEADVFIGWFDTCSREELRTEFLPAVERAIQEHETHTTLHVSE